MTPVRGRYSSAQLDLVNRQIELWVTNRDTGATADWLAEGVLTAPRGVRVGTADLLSVIEGWHRLFRDLHIDVGSLVASDDGNWMAIEWTWRLTRRSDGATSLTPDAIIVELRDGKILEWREYFDTFGSVEFELREIESPESAGGGGAT
jgi:ketosteroid isomerase-like protein